MTCFNFNFFGMAFNGRLDTSVGMDFQHHADRLLIWADQLQIDRFSILAHDTGATIARLVAAQQTDRVDRLVLLNTQIP